MLETSVLQAKMRCRPFLCHVESLSKNTVYVTVALWKCPFSKHTRGSRLEVRILCDASASTRNSKVPPFVMKVLTVTAQYMARMQSQLWPEQRVFHAGMGHDVPPLLSPRQAWRFHEPS